MSRAYRVKVRESLKRVIRAQDHVGTQLELLQILPAEQMAGLLEAELERRGFKRSGKALVRKEAGVTTRVDPLSGTVTVQAEAEEQVKLESEAETRVYEEWGRSGEKQAKEAARQQLKANLKKQADRKESQLQRQVTDRLEGRLADLRKELDQAVNRVTAEALKQKAAQIGQIREMTEDPEKGSLTIVLEV